MNLYFPHQPLFWKETAEILKVNLLPISSPEFSLGCPFSNWPLWALPSVPPPTPTSDRVSVCIQSPSTPHSWAHSQGLHNLPHHQDCKLPLHLDSIMFVQKVLLPFTMIFESYNQRQCRVCVCFCCVGSEEISLVVYFLLKMNYKDY